MFDVPFGLFGAAVFEVEIIYLLYFPQILVNVVIKMKASFRFILFFLFAIIAWKIKAQDNYYVCK